MQRPTQGPPTLQGPAAIRLVRPAFRASNASRWRAALRRAWMLWWGALQAYMADLHGIPRPRDQAEGRSERRPTAFSRPARAQSKEAE